MSENQAREVSRHLAGCQICAAHLAFLGKVSTTFETAPLHHLDPEARQRLEELGEQFEVDRRRIKPSADVRWVRRLAAVAAVLFIVAAGKLVYEQHLSNQTPELTPVDHPHQRIDPAPEPVSEDRPSGSHSASPDSKGPAIMDADFTEGRPSAKTPATGESVKP
jgi:hypothetical protein